MGRKANDGRGRLGGRAKGTPNQTTSPIKARLKEYSDDYFDRCIEEVDEEGNPTGRMVSRFDQDLSYMKAVDRVKAHLELLKFHTPQMQSSSVDMVVDASRQEFTDRLTRLAAGEEIEAPED